MTLQRRPTSINRAIWAAHRGTPAARRPARTHELTLEVDDGNGGVDTDTVIVEVVDTTPPELTLVESSFSITIASAAPSAAVDVLLESGATATDVCDPSVDITFGRPVPTRRARPR